MRKEKGPGACPAFFVGEEKGPPKKAALGWKQNKNSKPFDLLFLKVETYFDTKCTPLRPFV